MHSDFESAAWAEHHHRLGEAIKAGIDKLLYAFERLQAVQYEAPWQKDRY